MGEESQKDRGLCDSKELTELLKSGDIEVLDRVTRCYGERLLMAARRYCARPDQAHDAVQDAALAAWKYGEGFRGDGSVDGWLVRLVATACNRMRRGQKNDSSRHVTEVELVDDDVTADTLVARSQMASQLGEALNTLKPDDRAIVILSDAQGWTAKEIAEALEMTPGAVRTRLSRLHAKLRDTLQHVER